MVPSTAAILSTPPRHACAIVRPRGLRWSRAAGRAPPPRAARAARRGPLAAGLAELGITAARCLVFGARGPGRYGARRRATPRRAAVLRFVGNVEARVEIGFERELAQQREAERIGSC